MTDTETPAETRDFHLGDLLTITDGHLVSPDGIGGVYEIIDFVTGMPHFTHQLPRGAEAIKPWLLEQHPWLADIAVPESALATRDTVLAWLATVTAERGERHAVRAMPEGQYVGREPLAELVEMAQGKPIIAVVAADEDGAR